MTKEELRRVYQDAYNRIIDEAAVEIVDDDDMEELQLQAHDAGLWAVYQAGRQHAA